jgi:hypothetical protein
MILLHVISDDEQQAIEIVDFLMEENLLLEAVCLEKVLVRKKKDSGKPESVNRTLIMGKTKSLLFNRIDEMLKDKYQDKRPVIYSIPIVQMDWEESKKLVDEVAKV